MARMKKIAFQVGLVAVLALACAATVQAQTFPLEDSPYHCRWERYASNQLTGKGVSLVTFTDVTYPQFYLQNGTLFTVYANASTLTRPYQVQLHVVSGSLYYVQDNPSPQADLNCQLFTSPSGNTVEWNCLVGGTGVKQWCYRP